MTQSPKLSAPPFSDRCYQCADPAFLPPVTRVQIGAWTRCDYVCPRCRSRWSVDFLTEYLGFDYSPEATRSGR